MDTMTTGIAGDWHGNGAWATHVLGAFAARGVRVAYHAGDFGLWPGSHGKQYLQRVHRALEANDQELFIVLGNHEDYDRVAVMRAGEDGWLRLRDYPRLRFAPRGHAWIDRGCAMAALGGAFSIDKGFRAEGRDWWPQESITSDDCAALAGNVRAMGWQAVDVLITHDAPAGLTRKGLHPKPAWFTEEIQAEAYRQRVLLRDAADQVAPRWLAHGHWHEWARDGWDGIDASGAAYRCEVVGLASDGLPGNAIVAELVPGRGLDSVEALWGSGWRRVAASA